jgi:hypothetical protein
MKHQSELKAVISHIALVSLMAMIVLSVACSNGESNNVASSQNNQTTNAKVAGATPPDNQTNSQMEAANAATPSHRPADNEREKNATKPDIQITDVPSKGAGPDAMERISGNVNGVNVSECKVVIFTHTDKWYVQPYIDSSDTPIRDDGTWENDTHLGSDYAALLVKAAYKPPATTGTLPNIGGNVLAIGRATVKK